MGHSSPCPCVRSVKDGESARHARETPPQAAVRALTGRRLRFPEPSRFGVGTAGMGVGAERGLTHGGSAELEPPREPGAGGGGPGGWSSMISQGSSGQDGLSAKPALRVQVPWR